MKRFDVFFKANGLFICIMGGIFFGVWRQSLYAGCWMTVLMTLPLGIAIEAFETRES